MFNLHFVSQSISIAEVFFLYHLLHKPRTYFHVCLKMVRLEFFPTSYAATWNQTHLSSVSPLRGTSIQDALLTELSRLCHG